MCHSAYRTPSDDTFRFDNAKYVLQIEQTTSSRSMRQIRLTPHSRKQFKFMKKNKASAQGLEEITEEQLFSIPDCSAANNKSPDLNICDEIKDLDEREDWKNSNISILTSGKREPEFCHGEAEASPHEGDINQSPPHRDTRQHIKPENSAAGQESCVPTKRSNKLVARINLAAIPQAGEQAKDDIMNLSETRKFENLPALNKTLKSKALVSLSRQSKLRICLTHDSADAELAEENRTSINIPKTFDRNMKSTHRVYLRKEEHPQPMRRKNLQIEIPEPPKEEELMMNHSELVRRLKNYIKTSTTGSAKKKTADVDVSNII